MKVSLLFTWIFVLVSPMMAETPNGIVYKVRLANGASQFYQIVVHSSIPPANAAKWATPSVAQNKLSAQGAGIVAVGWAGGWSTREKGGPSNSMTNIGGITPGGFYNASNVRFDSVQLQNDPVPYYLVRMSGQIGETRQTLYAAVLPGWTDHQTDAGQQPISGYTHRRRQQIRAGCWGAEADSVKGKERPQATRSTGEKGLLRRHSHPTGAQNLN
jgi:hypothetical protein